MVDHMTLHELSYFDDVNCQGGSHDSVGSHESHRMQTRYDLKDKYFFKSGFQALTRRTVHLYYLLSSVTINDEGIAALGHGDSWHDSVEW
eukprot:4697301-Amphidinium_carterae.1